MECWNIFRPYGDAGPNFLWEIVWDGQWVSGHISLADPAPISPAEAPRTARHPVALGCSG